MVWLTIIFEVDFGSADDADHETEKRKRSFSHRILNEKEKRSKQRVTCGEGDGDGESIRFAKEERLKSDVAKPSTRFFLYDADKQEKRQSFWVEQLATSRTQILVHLYLL